MVEGLGNEVTINWFQPNACYRPKSVTIYVKGSGLDRKVVVSAEENHLTLTDLREETQYELKAKITYEGDIDSPLSNFAFNSGQCAPDATNCELPPNILFTSMFLLFMTLTYLYPGGGGSIVGLIVGSVIGKILYLSIHRSLLSLFTLGLKLMFQLFSLSY